jgi:L-amino acid N-acyltransferase YncA
MVCIRTATISDAPGILEIYSPFVRHTATSFETALPSITEIEGRISKCLQKFPWLVCTIDGTVAGYAYASSHREREAYQWNAESSVYVNKNFRCKGIAGALYTALFDLLKTQGIRNVYAGITLPNDASVKLHELFGFTLFATYDHVGYKLGQWHKVGWWKLGINHYDPEPPPPLKFSDLDPPYLSGLLNTAAGRIRSSFI